MSTLSRVDSQEGLNGVDGLQNYFIKEMADYVRSLGKEVMAWDDAFIEKEPQDLLYTYWRDWLSDQPGKITRRLSDCIHGMGSFLS